MKWVKRTTLGMVCAFFFVGTIGQSQTVEIRTFFDLDHDASTGCTVSTIDGQFFGAEEVLITTVDVLTSQVIKLERQVCNGAVLGPRVMFDASTWNVGVGLGTNGSDVVETYLPIDRQFVAPYIQVGFDANNLNGGEDALLLNENSGPLDIFIYVPVPTLGTWFLMAFAILVMGAALWHLRKHPMNTTVLMVLFAFISIGISGARIAGVVLDGDPSDWFANDRLSTDPEGETPDIEAVFGKHLQGQVFLRIDIALNTPPVADASNTNVDEDGSVLIGLTASDADGDSLIFSINSIPVIFGILISETTR